MALLVAIWREWIRETAAQPVVAEHEAIIHHDPAPTAPAKPKSKARAS